MIDHIIAVSIITVLAAGCFGASYVIEQRKAAEAPIEVSMKPALLLHMAKQPMWWVAMAIDVGGYGFQAWALAIGSVAFVQPMLVLCLPFALVIAHIVGSHRITTIELALSGVFVVSLAVFLWSSSPASGVDTRPLSNWLVPMFIVSGMALACVVAAAECQPSIRAFLLGIGAGGLFGLSSLLTKSVTRDLSRGVVGILGHWELYALGVVAVAALWLMTSAFQAGGLKAALPAIVLSEPVIGVLLGVSLFKEHLRVDGEGSWVLVGISVVMMLVIAGVLARATAIGSTSTPSDPHSVAIR